MRLEDLRQRRVGIVGFGREGQSVARKLLDFGPAGPVPVFCETPPVSPQQWPEQELDLRVGPLADQPLTEMQVLVCSPGVSIYRPEIQAAKDAGVTLTSSTALWFAEARSAPVIGVTGTKGKSTTCKLIEHLLVAAGRRVGLGGNIGIPVWELPPADVYVVELSSYQLSLYAGGADVVLLTNLFPEHLDWHGGVDCYYRDKLNIFRDGFRCGFVNGRDPVTMERTSTMAGLELFNAEPGWIVRPSGIYHGLQRRWDYPDWRLKGEHNAANLAAALSAVDALEVDLQPGVDALPSFRGLPHRLQRVGQRHGVQWIDDSISTTPQTTLAALMALSGQELVVIVGGHDRGLDWEPVARHLAAHPVRCLVLNGANRERVSAAMARYCPDQPLVECEDLDQAVFQAQRRRPPSGAILLSPGAPSYDQFSSFEERGRRFLRLLETAGSD